MTEIAATPRFESLNAAFSSAAKRARVFAESPASLGVCRLVRLSNGKFAIANFKQVTLIGGRDSSGAAFREWCINPAGSGLVVGDLSNLAELADALQGVVSALRPQTKEE